MQRARRGEGDLLGELVGRILTMANSEATKKALMRMHSAAIAR